MTIDRVSNMLSSLKNAVVAGKPYIEIVHTKECEAILKVLKTKRFVDEIKTFKLEGKPFKMMRVSFLSDKDSLTIEKIKRISKPGRRMYKSASELAYIAGGYGVQVVSTSRGIMSSIEAKKKKLGGEVICEVR